MEAILSVLKSTFIKFISTTDYAMSYNQIRFFVFLLVFLSIYFLLIHKSLRKIWILVNRRRLAQDRSLGERWSDTCGNCS